MAEKKRVTFQIRRYGPDNDSELKKIHGPTVARRIGPHAELRGARLLPGDLDETIHRVDCQASVHSRDRFSLRSDRETSDGDSDPEPVTGRRE